MPSPRTWPPARPSRPGTRRCDCPPCKATTRTSPRGAHDLDRRRPTCRGRLGAVLTVTVPDQELLDRLTDLSDRVELVLWDLLSPLPKDVAARVQVVQIGHYWAAPDRWVRLYEAPNLEYVMLPSAGFEHAIPRVPPGII